MSRALALERIPPATDATTPGSQCSGSVAAHGREGDGIYQAVQGHPRLKWSCRKRAAAYLSPDSGFATVLRTAIAEPDHGVLTVPLSVPP